MQTVTTQTKQVSLILLAGGKGARFKSAIPKQFALFRGEPLIFHSLKTFLKIPLISEIIVVCPYQYRELFHIFPVIFANPGKERQDSVLSGAQKASHPLLLIHDGARPLVYPEEVNKLILHAQTYGASTLASPAEYTIKKRCKPNGEIQTLDRSELFITHTPQCIRKDILLSGMQQAKKLGKVLTDDVSAAEILNHPVHLVLTENLNIKVTYQRDLKLIESTL
ncbi:2-C-methyl-D-erythritol 4-phosphate cytidylyltransferase [Chlamydiifrater phoenicopteri]|uniref:2-C-methyl-D-erythritol 4-phosphate cytidylyltransferase n=1 Tax=Chlamydiifrater phoenicopteri TaxID=2681469 RepID=UPI001BCFC270|nr:2-C-methyl-D-erythritol 4-phosphate cytidylyltransferase [Chlamydiifrater phoenicopteri]